MPKVQYSAKEKLAILEEIECVELSIMGSQGYFVTGLQP